MKQTITSFFIATLVCVLLCGCHVANRRYHPASASIYAPPEESEDASAKKKDEVKHWGPADCNPGAQPCLAFLEFDEMGEMWEPRQLDNAIRLIETAQKGADEHHPPVVITFTHGWKNNAEQHSDAEGQVIDRAYR